MVSILPWYRFCHVLASSDSSSSHNTTEIPNWSQHFCQLHSTWTWAKLKSAPFSLRCGALATVRRRAPSKAKMPLQFIWIIVHLQWIRLIQLTCFRMEHYVHHHETQISAVLIALVKDDITIFKWDLWLYYTASSSIKMHWLIDCKENSRHSVNYSATTSIDYETFLTIVWGAETFFSLHNPNSGPPKPDIMYSLFLICYCYDIIHKHKINQMIHQLEVQKQSSKLFKFRSLWWLGEDVWNHFIGAYPFYVDLFTLYSVIFQNISYRNVLCSDTLRYMLIHI